jgi:hypothetical protein
VLIPTLPVGVVHDLLETVRCAFSPWILRVRVVGLRLYGARFPTKLYTRGCHWIPRMFRLKLLHACDQWHSSRKFAPLTGLHCKLRPNTEGHQPSSPNLQTLDRTDHELCHPLLNGLKVINHLAQTSIRETPVYFVSPKSKHSLDYANICAHWLCQSKAERVNLPEWYGARFHHGFCCVRVTAIGSTSVRCAFSTGICTR